MAVLASAANPAPRAVGMSRYPKLELWFPFEVDPVDAGVANDFPPVAQRDRLLGKGQLRVHFQEVRHATYIVSTFIAGATRPG